jgi:hypothetical protein
MDHAMMSRILTLLALLSALIKPATALEIKSDARPGALPSLTAPGEIAINRADGRFFYRDENGNRAGGLLPDLDASGYLKFRNGMTLGRWQGGKFISQPDTVQIQGFDSTGRVDKMTVAPPNLSAERSLSGLANSVYALAPTSDTPDTVRPVPKFLLAPVGTELITASAFWSRIKDKSDETLRVFAHVLTYESSTGEDKPVGDLSGERVDLFLGMRGLPGAGSIWGTNIQVHMAEGYLGHASAGAEIGVVNSSGHRGDGFGQIPYTALNSTGIGVNTYSSYRNGQGYFIDGKLTDGSPGWNRGFVVYNGAINSNWGCAFCDYGGSYATLQSYGSHTAGLDFTNATFALDAVALPAGSGVNWLSGGVSKGRIVVNADGRMTLIASSLSLEGVPFATSAAAGGASALPGTPALYIPITYAGAVRYIPAYNGP